MIRVFAIIPLLLLCAIGCKSKGKVYRDYRSNRDASLDFLSETFKEGEEMRQESWRETWQVKQRTAENKVESKQSVAFFWESIHAESRENAREALKQLNEEFRIDSDEYWRRVRFGFLDSGD